MLTPVARMLAAGLNMDMHELFSVSVSTIRWFVTVDSRCYFHKREM